MDGGSREPRDECIRHDPRGHVGQFQGADGTGGHLHLSDVGRAGAGVRVSIRARPSPG